MSVIDEEMRFIHKLMGHLIAVNKIEFYALAHDYSSLQHPYILQVRNKCGETQTLCGKEIWDAIKLDTLEFLINYENRIPIGE